MTKKFQQEQCPVCEAGIMTPHDNGTYKFHYQRQAHTVTGIHYAKCDVCEASGYLSGQLTYNKKVIEAFQKNLVSIISPTQILTLREKYSLTQLTASKIFGGGVNAFSRWERGVIVPAEPTAKLMLLALDDAQVLLNLAKISNVEIDLPISNNTSRLFRRKTDASVHITPELASEDFFDVSTTASRYIVKPSSSYHRKSFIPDIFTISEDEDPIYINTPIWQKEKITQSRTLN